LQSNEKKIGLALSSGAARGLAHIGVLAALEKEGIHVDMVAGSSMGAMVGALYAQGRDAAEMDELARYWGSRWLSLLADPTLPRTGLVRGHKIDNMLKEIFGNVSFSDLKIPFACNATDIETGDEVIIKHGLVRKGVIASGSIPVILKPVKREGRYLVDGALANPVPVSILRDMGANFIIAVNTIPSVQARHKGDSVDQQGMMSREPNILSVVMQITHIVNYRGLKTSLTGADIIIEPQVTKIGWSDFHRASECILKGKLAAQAAISEIKDKLVSSGIPARR